MGMTGRWMSSGHLFYPQGTKSADRSGAETEPAPPDRQSGVLTVILWSYVSCTGRRIPARLLFNMQTFSSANSYRDGIYHYDLVQSHIQHSCQYDQVVNGRHCRTCSIKRILNIYLKNDHENRKLPAQLHGMSFVNDVSFFSKFSLAYRISVCYHC